MSSQTTSAHRCSPGQCPGRSRQPGLIYTPDSRPTNLQVKRPDCCRYRSYTQECFCVDKLVDASRLKPTVRPAGPRGPAPGLCNPVHADKCPRPACRDAQPVQRRHVFCGAPPREDQTPNALMRSHASITVRRGFERRFGRRRSWSNQVSTRPPRRSGAHTDLSEHGAGASSGEAGPAPELTMPPRKGASSPEPDR